MEHPGERLRRVRERLKLTYRQVAEASRKVAERRGNREFSVGISRLADIENQGKVPTIFRLYSLKIFDMTRVELRSLVPSSVLAA